jgi:hypothetical protein
MGTDGVEIWNSRSSFGTKLHPSESGGAQKNSNLGSRSRQGEGGSFQGCGNEIGSISTYWPGTKVSRFSCARSIRFGPEAPEPRRGQTLLDFILPLIVDQHNAVLKELEYVGPVSILEHLQTHF